MCKHDFFQTGKIRYIGYNFIIPHCFFLCSYLVTFFLALCLFPCVCVPELCDLGFRYRLFHLFSCSPSDLTLTTETVTVTGLGVLTSCQSRTASKSISRWTCARCTSSRSWAPKVGTPTAWVMSLPSDTGSSTAVTAAAGWAGMTEREGR